VEVLGDALLSLLSGSFEALGSDRLRMLAGPRTFLNFIIAKL
jgi:hypothetical protein